ncbi:MAG: sugar ABC transporter permease, partial [Clostridiales bacterium]|jgi:ABC-type sugar transport system permease subunit|nr:sugar ABC transporter permease [Clostridiales bacterium]
MAFDHFILLTYGGPGRATETLMVLIYKESFKANRMGYGAAVSMILLAIVLLLAVFQTKLLRSRELEG